MAKNVTDLEKQAKVTEADVDALIAAHREKDNKKAKKNFIIKDERLLKIVKWATLIILVAATVYLAVMMVIGINFMNEERNEADKAYSEAQNADY